MSWGKQTRGIYMKYFEDAFKFVSKNYLILIPIFIATLVPALLVIGSSPSATELQSMLIEFQQYPDYFLNNPDAIFEALNINIANFASGGAISTILNFMAIPMTAGLIKLGLNKSEVSINDFAPALSTNIGKYLRYFLAGILLGLVIAVALIIYVVILALILNSLGDSGVFVLLFGILLLIVFGFSISFFLAFWFAAMVLDDLGAMAALKKSFAVAKRCFWTLVGIGLLLGLVQGVVSSIVGFFAFIPLLPMILNNLIVAVAAVVHMTFLFMIYRSFQPAINQKNEDVNVIY